MSTVFASDDRPFRLRPVPRARPGCAGPPPDSRLLFHALRLPCRHSRHGAPRRAWQGGAALGVRAVRPLPEPGGGPASALLSVKRFLLFMGGAGVRGCTDLQERLAEPCTDAAVWYAGRSAPAARFQPAAEAVLARTTMFRLIVPVS
jgi:hypothetical protein